MAVCEKQSFTVGLLGASMDTGNLGVSALAESVVKCILHRWPDAEISFIGVGRRPGVCKRTISGRDFVIKMCPVRFSPKVFVADHLIFIFLWGLVFRVLSLFGVKALPHKGTAGIISRCDLIVDITGGDSFSDIYGMRRFIMGYLQKSLAGLYGKPLILMPQTYGPYSHPLAKALARRVLRYAMLVLSRDRAGVDYAKGILGKDCEKVKLCPDVAFVLDSLRPNTEQTTRIEQLKAEDQQLVGLNISGLLYNGGYTGRNEFGLQCDYKSLVRNIVLHFARQKGRFVLLVPHVIPPQGYGMENDLLACREVWRSIVPEKQEKVIVLDGKYDQSEVKYLIGLCDFFIGARMHSTIAALSQCVPAVGMAYGKKFAGVFETARVEGYVVDMRQMDDSQILDRINELHNMKESARKQLAEIMPDVQKKVMSLFDAIQSLPQSTQRARSSRAVTKEETTNFH